MKKLKTQFLPTLFFKKYYDLLKKDQDMMHQQVQEGSVKFPLQLAGWDFV